MTLSLSMMELYRDILDEHSLNMHVIKQGKSIIIVSVTEIHRELLILLVKINSKKSNKNLLKLLNEKNHITEHCLKMY